MTKKTMFSINKESKREAFYVPVERQEEIQNAGLIYRFSEEHKIMEAVYHHDCIDV